MAEVAGEVTGKERRAQTTVTMDPPRTFRRVPLLPHQLLSKITAQRDLFVLAHVGVPRIDPADMDAEHHRPGARASDVQLRPDPANAEETGRGLSSMRRISVEPEDRHAPRRQCRLGRRGFENIARQPRRVARGAFSLVVWARFRRIRRRPFRRLFERLPARSARTRRCFARLRDQRRAARRRARISAAPAGAGILRDQFGQMAVAAASRGPPRGGAFHHAALQ